MKRKRGLGERGEEEGGREGTKKRREERRNCKKHPAPSKYKRRKKETEGSQKTEQYRIPSRLHHRPSTAEPMRRMWGGSTRIARPIGVLVGACSNLWGIRSTFPSNFYNGPMHHSVTVSALPHTSSSTSRSWGRPLGQGQQNLGHPVFPRPWSYP